MDAPKQPNIDLKSTEGMKNADGGSIFKSGVILRKIIWIIQQHNNQQVLQLT